MYLKYLQNFFDDDDPDDCICNAASLVPKVMSKLKVSSIDFYELLSLRKKYLYLELFWSTFSAFGPHSVQIIQIDNTAEYCNNESNHSVTL